jgi:hypothetical protein
VVNVADGSVKFVASNKGRLLALHGALMLVSFGLLLPLGTLVSRHKWMFKGLEVSAAPAAAAPAAAAPATGVWVQAQHSRCWAMPSVLVLLVPIHTIWWGCETAQHVVHAWVQPTATSWRLARTCLMQSKNTKWQFSV